MSLTARAEHGRLLLDVPTDLPDGAAIELVPAATWEDLDPEEQRALEADFELAEQEFLAGDYEPASNLIAWLRAQR